MFTAALFTIANVWKQPKYAWTDKWIKRTEHYSAIKRMK